MGGEKKYILTLMLFKFIFDTYLSVWVEKKYIFKLIFLIKYFTIIK